MVFCEFLEGKLNRAHSPLHLQHLAYVQYMLDIQKPFKKQINNRDNFFMYPKPYPKCFMWISSLILHNNMIKSLAL